jgi:hypothetical protein
MLFSGPRHLPSLTAENPRGGLSVQYSFVKYCRRKLCLFSLQRQSIYSTYWSLRLRALSLLLDLPALVSGTSTLSR